MEVQGFDSIDDLFDHLRERESWAGRRLHDEQKALAWGSHFVHFTEEAVIFGRCLPVEEIRLAEANLGADEAEVDYEVERLTESQERGYLFGWHYSTIEPTGELGSTHKLSCWPIDKAVFDAAAAAGWVPQEMDGPHLAGLELAYQGYRRHMIAVASRGGS